MGTNWRVVEDMKMVRGAPMVQPKQVARIFGNIEMVHSLHSKQYAFSDLFPVALLSVSR